MSYTLSFEAAADKLSVDDILVSIVLDGAMRAPASAREQDKTRQDKRREEKTRQDKTRHVTTRQDLKRHDKRKQDKTSNIHLIIQIII